ncbi:MAG: hypothetical protein ACKVS6_14750 [Planctomycetota bacterium]
MFFAVRILMNDPIQSPIPFLGRRDFIVASAGILIASQTLQKAAGGDEPESRPADVKKNRIYQYEDFLKDAVPAAKQLVGDTSRAGQDRYLHTIAALACLLLDVPAPKMTDKGNGTAIGANPSEAPFVVLHWKMEPGSVITPHPHIYGNVVTICLEGEVRVSNYEVMGEPDYNKKGTFQVRKTVDQWLSPGHTNLVNLDKNYIHGFEAGRSGARGLDITTKIRERVPSPSMDVAKIPRDASRSIFDASWLYL